MVRVWVEMFTPTLTSLLPDAELESDAEPASLVAELVEASLCSAEPVASTGSVTDALSLLFVPSNLYGIR